MRRTPLKRKSDKARARDVELRESSIEVDRRSAGYCEVSSPECYSGPHRAHHKHHVRLRSQGGGHGPDNLLNVCANAHGWIHANPAEAAARGWLARRHG